MRTVKLTRKGQVTIPVDFRRRNKLDESSRLRVVDEGFRLVLHPITDMLEEAGADAERYDARQLKTMLDRSRLKWR